MDNNPETIDNNMLFGVYEGQYVGLSLNNKKVNRSANVLVIGGTGTGKTFKYVKPNILQENCSMVITDPSGDIFRSFAPYLLSRGYNVYLFNVSDPTLSNTYNPLLNVYDAKGEISERHVNILVDLYMKNAKAGNEAGGGDPFWDKSEKAFLTGLIYYVLENDEIPRRDKCFNKILELVQKAKVSDDDDEESPLTTELNTWYAKMDHMGRKYKTKLYYDTFLIAPQKTANTILITTAVDLQIFATVEIDHMTRYNEDYKDLNINLDKIATEQSYLFLGIPQSHQAYNFLIAMLYSQLYNRFYELGESKIRGKWHLGYRIGTPVFAPFESEAEAKEFYETVSKENIVPNVYINGTEIYSLMWRGKCYKTSMLKDPIEKWIEDLDKDKMYIWAGDDFAGGDPSLPIHVNFLLDEFKNIGEIPNFLTILSTSRKYRIGSHVVIQDLGQIKTMYKENEHETLLANVDTTIFLGSIQQEDKEYIQKMLGKTTIRQRSTSSSKSGPSTSYTPTEVNLMSIDEISAINQGGRDDELVIVRDTTPFLCQKLNLTHHKRWQKVCDVKKLHLDVTKYYRNSEKQELYS
jgi:type IV secretory pathway TraG/TraD family ATPase VirD4